MNFENFKNLKKKDIEQIEQKKFDVEAFVKDLQLEIKKVDGSTNFEHLGKKYAYLIGDIVRAEKTKMLNGTEYICLEFSAIDALNENKEVPLYQGNFTYVKDDENPNGKMWISKMVGTSHSENIKENDLQGQPLNNINKISNVVTNNLDKIDEEKFLYRKS